MILRHHFPRNVWEWCLFIIKKEYGGKRMKLKKVLSMALSLAMIMSIVPGNVFAADLDADVAVEDFSDDVTVGVEENVVSEESEIIEEDSDQAAEVDFQEENDDIRQDFAQEVSNDDIALFSDGVVKESEEENIVASGTLNEGVYAVFWKLYEDGNLIFSGNGSINGYSKYNAPWYQYRQKINRIIIEDGIKEIGNGDFYGCNNVNEVIIGKSVRNIEFDAFRECINLKSVTFSDSLKQICDSAFRNCSSLVSIEIPESVITIQNYAFSGCKNLSKVELHEGLTSLGENAFNDCSSLEKIKIPNGVHGLSKQIFYNCAKLTSIILPKSITYIEFEAFGGCSSLTEIQIPNGVGSIRGYAFSECKKLSKLEIPESVTYIEDGAFDGCDGLEIVELPKSCKKISKWSFTNCNNLKIIRYAGTENEWSELGINMNNDKVKVYCNYVAQHTHVYEKEIISNPTCETVGYAKETCKLCGESYTENIKATGHAWDAGKITKDASCEETGVKTYTCTSCKATKTEDIKALGHKEVKDAAVEATCEKDGLTEGSHCSVCNKVLTEQKKVPATGHEFSSWKTISQATVFSPEKQSHSCSACGKSEQREVGSALQKTIRVSATSLPLKTKQKTTVLRVSGLAVGDSIVSWKSNNTKVVRVSGRANGTSTIIAGNKKGKAKITITLKSGLKKVVTVTIQKTDVKTKKITGVAKNLKLKRKQKAVLRPVLAPVTSKQKIIYKSSNTKVATVNSKGQITAKKKGTAVITVKSGSKTVKCKVTVR